MRTFEKKAQPKPSRCHKPDAIFNRVPWAEAAAGAATTNLEPAKYGHVGCSGRRNRNAASTTVGKQNNSNVASGARTSGADVVMMASPRLAPRLAVNGCPRSRLRAGLEPVFCARRRATRHQTTWTLGSDHDALTGFADAPCRVRAAACCCEPQMTIIALRNGGGLGVLVSWTGSESVGPLPGRGNTMSS